MVLKILHRTLVCLGGLSGSKRAKVPPTAGLGIFLARIQPVPNHKILVIIA